MNRRPLLSRRGWVEIGVAYISVVFVATISLYNSWSWPHLPGTERLFPDIGIEMLAIGMVVALGIFAYIAYQGINHRFMIPQAVLTTGLVGASQSLWNNELAGIVHPASAAGGAWIMFIAYEISIITTGLTVAIGLSLLVLFIPPIREAMRPR